MREGYVKQNEKGWWDIYCKDESIGEWFLYDYDITYKEDALLFCGLWNIEIKDEKR